MKREKKREREMKSNITGGCNIQGNFNVRAKRGSKAVS